MLPIALLLLAVPALATQLLIPPDNSEPALSELVLALGLTLLSAIAGLIGAIAITHLALQPGASVREALQLGLRRFFPLLISSLLIGIAFALVAFLLIVLFAGNTLEEGPIDPVQLVAALAPIMLVLLVLGVALWVRFMLMTPVATAERVGPIEIIRRSFLLTKGHYWRLLGAILLLLLVAMVALIAVSLVLGISVVLLFGPPEFGNTTWIINGVVSTIFQTILTVILAVLVARIYTQLRGSVSPEVFA